MCKELFPDAVQILDFYHMSENIHNYAKFIYPEDEVGRKIWVNKFLNNLNSGKIEEAIELVKEKTKDKIPDGVVNLWRTVYSHITD